MDQQHKRNTNTIQTQQKCNTNIVCIQWKWNRNFSLTITVWRHDIHTCMNTVISKNRGMGSLQYQYAKRYCPLWESEIHGCLVSPLVKFEVAQPPHTRKFSHGANFRIFFTPRLQMQKNKNCKVLNSQHFHTGGLLPWWPCHLHEALHSVTITRQIIWYSSTTFQPCSER